MQTVFEIFDCVTGATQGFRVGLEFARRTVDRAAPHAILDYSPTAAEGFYVVAKGASDIEKVCGAPFADKRDASDRAGFLDMASDTLSHRVVEHSLD